MLHYWVIAACQLFSFLKEMLRLLAVFLHKVNRSESFDHMVTHHLSADYNDWRTTELSSKNREVMSDT
jgi:hypothetical protein